MVEQLQEHIDEEKAIWDFSSFMTQNWDTASGRWAVKNDLDKAIRDGDQANVAALEEEVRTVKAAAIQLEENVYLTRIASCNASKAWAERYAARNSGGATPEQVAEYGKILASTFDRDLWRAETQLENHRRKYGTRVDD